MANASQAQRNPEAVNPTGQPRRKRGPAPKPSWDTLNSQTASDFYDPAAAELASPVRLPHAAIAQRAYFIWQEHGCPDGQAETHWFEARRQLGCTPAGR